MPGASVKDMTNGFFKVSDPRLQVVAGFALPAGWWSRPWEYSWALSHALLGQIAADMGCGYTYRPFKDALAAICAKVYAVDANSKVLELPGRERLEYVVADISKPIEAIESGSLDRIFCISVLEDAQRALDQILAEFRRLLKPDGLAVLTFDVPYDWQKECKVYPGLSLESFFKALDGSSLNLSGELNLDKNGAVVHDDWNLCVFHCILEAA